MPIDIVDFLAFLSQERYRAIIIHAEPKNSVLVTHFAKKTNEILKGKYLDLLACFIETNELSKNIDSFTPDDFRSLMIEQSKDSPLLVVDRIDFLLDTWRRQQLKKFYQMLSDQWDGYKEGMKAMIILCIQSSNDLENQHFSDSQSRSRVFHLSDFNDF